MKKLIQFLLLPIFSLSLLSCGDSHADASDDLLDHMEEMIGVLEELADGGEVKAAIERFDELADEASDLGARFKELGEADPELEKELEETHKERLEKNEKRMAEVMAKLGESDKMTPELLQAMGEAMPETK